MESSLNFAKRMRKDLVANNNVIDHSLFDVTAPISEDIVYERKELKQIAKPIFYFLENNGLKQHIVVMGDKGSGKTALVKFILEEFSNDKSISNFKYDYVNCRSYPTSYKILRTLTGNGQKTPIEEMYTKLEKDNKQKRILILDEVDLLKDDNLIYCISRYEKLQHIYLVMITNKMFYVLTEDTKSSLQHEFFYLKTYDAQEIIQILMMRAEKGLKSFDKNLIHKIGALNYKNYNADIRIGIKATQKIFGQTDYVSPNDVELKEIMDKVELSCINETITNLTERKILMLYLLKKEMTLNDLHEKINIVEGIPSSKFQIRRLLDDLKKLDLIKTKSNPNKNHAIIYSLMLEKNNIDFIDRYVSVKLPDLVK